MNPPSVHGRPSQGPTGRYPLEQTPYPLEPLTVGALLDRTFRIFSRDFPLLMGIVLLTHIPILLVGMLGVLIQPEAIAEGAVSLPQMIGVLVGTFGGLILFFLLVYPVAVGAITYAVSELYVGRSLNIGDAFQRALNRLGKLLSAQMQVGLWVMLGMILLIVPGIIWMIRYLFVTPIIMIELDKDRPAAEALERSRELMRGHGWRIAGMLLLLSLVGLILSGVGAGVVSILGLEGEGVGMGARMVGSLISQLIGLVATPLGLIANVLFYYDLRIRKDGFDLEMLSLALQQSGSPSGNQAPPQTGVPR